MFISIRDARNSVTDRNWIQATFGEYLDDLMRMSLNTGIFPAAGNFGGEFGDRQPDMMARWFVDDASHPLVILKDDHIVGFALVSRPLIKKSDSSDYRLSEFFIARNARRLGIGKQASELIFNRFDGKWEVTEILRNQPAVAFWRTVVNTYTHGDYRESIINGEVRHIFKTQLSPAQRRVR